MMMVGNVDEPFTPVPPEELLVDWSNPDARQAFYSLLEELPQFHGQHRHQSTCFGAAIRVGLETLVRLLARSAATLVIQH